jgi:hypothetical protein
VNHFQCKKTQIIFNLKQKQSCRKGDEANIFGSVDNPHGHKASRKSSRWRQFLEAISYKQTNVSHGIETTKREATICLNSSYWGMANKELFRRYRFRNNGDRSKVNLSYITLNSLLQNLCFFHFIPSTAFWTSHSLSIFFKVFLSASVLLYKTLRKESVLAPVLCISMPCTTVIRLSFIHSSMVLQLFVGPWPLLQFRNLLHTDGRAPWTSDQPVARPLPTHRTTQTQKKCTHRHSCLEWDSNPWSQRWSERPSSHCDLHTID